jgi:hypothetical protein
MPSRTLPARRPLVKQLASRIGAPPTSEEPYIIQDRVPQTRSRHALSSVQPSPGRIGRLLRMKLAENERSGPIAVTPSDAAVSRGTCHSR